MRLGKCERGGPHPGLAPRRERRVPARVGWGTTRSRPYEWLRHGGGGLKAVGDLAARMFWCLVLV